MWIKPRRIRSKLLKQGVGGPKPSFLYGNTREMQKIQSMASKSGSQNQSVSHEWVRSIFPYLLRWSQQYGPVFMYSTGNKQHLYVSQPEVIKELHLHKSLDLGKASYLAQATEPMLGNGILRANGTYWAHQRKVIAPEFFLQKVKHMLAKMEECTMPMIREWESRVVTAGGVADIIIDQDLRTVSADIISKTCFGSSYSQGKQIFAKLASLQEAILNASYKSRLPSFRYSLFKHVYLKILFKHVRIKDLPVKTTTECE